MIDILGGVDIEMTSKEAKTINIGTEAGVYHLDGTKALAYSRIRKIDNDFYRTQRQRNVLQAIYTKFRQSNAADLMKLLDEVLPYLSTDMTELANHATGSEVHPNYGKCRALQLFVSRQMTHTIMLLSEVCRWSSRIWTKSTRIY